MSIKLIDIKEEFVSCGELFVIGATLAKCPRKNFTGYGDMVMTADLFDGSDSNVGTMQWRSRDGGESWLQEGLIEHSYVCDFEESKIKCGYGGMFADEKAGVMVFLASDTYWMKGNARSIIKYRKLYYRLSYDNAATWTDKRYIIQNGKEGSMTYDSTHFMKDVVYGRNMAAIVGPKVIRADDDSLLISVQTQIVDKNGEIVEPSGFMFIKCGALKAFWNADALDYTWEFGNYAEVAPNESSRGVYEPTFARLGKNTFVMVMRGSNLGFRDTIIGQKFYSVSTDNACSWTAPKPLTYDDGSTMFSSSCIPKLLEHSNGNVYYIGMINDENPDGNLPRYPLCIAQFDKATCTIIKATVTQIDTRRNHHKESEKYTKNVVDYSNHLVYEDDNGHIIVMAPYRPDLTSYRSTLNRYVIEV